MFVDSREPENRKLIGFHGLLGRRWYAINLILLLALSALLAGVFFSLAGSLGLTGHHARDFSILIWGRVIAMLLMAALAGLWMCYILAGLVYRRVRDIIPERRLAWLWAVFAYVFQILPFPGVLVAIALMMWPGEMDRRETLHNLQYGGL